MIRTSLDGGVIRISNDAICAYNRAIEHNGVRWVVALVSVDQSIRCFNSDTDAYLWLSQGVLPKMFLPSRMPFMMMSDRGIFRGRKCTAAVTKTFSVIFDDDPANVCFLSKTKKLEIEPIDD